MTTFEKSGVTFDHLDCDIRHTYQIFCIFDSDSLMKQKRNDNGPERYKIDHCKLQYL